MSTNLLKCSTADLSHSGSLVQLQRGKASSSEGSENCGKECHSTLSSVIDVSDHSSGTAAFNQVHTKSQKISKSDYLIEGVKNRTICNIKNTHIVFNSKEG
jgi:hypothetical protein